MWYGFSSRQLWFLLNLPDAPRHVMHVVKQERLLDASRVVGLKILLTFCIGRIRYLAFEGCAPRLGCAWTLQLNK